MTDPTRVRIGVLGAARIVKDALLTPSHGMPGVEVTAIAAREPARAVTVVATEPMGVPDGWEELELWHAS